MAQSPFPRACQFVAKHHHFPLAAPYAERPLVSVVHIADTICCQANCGFNLTARHQQIDRSCMEQMHLSDAIIGEVSSSLPALLADASDLLA